MYADIRRYTPIRADIRRPDMCGSVRVGLIGADRCRSVRVGLIGADRCGSARSKFQTLIAPAMEIWESLKKWKIEKWKNGKFWNRVVPYGTIWYHMVPWWYHMVPYGAIWYHMVPYGTLWCHMVPYDTIWYQMVPYGTIWYRRSDGRTVEIPEAPQV